MTLAVVADNIYKTYKKSVPALDGVSISIERGRCPGCSGRTGRARRP